MNGKLLQRCFVNILHSMLMEEMNKPSPRYKSNMDFAQKAFPNDTNAHKTWQSIKLGQKGKPREVSIEEAFGLAQAFDEKVDRLLVKAEVLIENGWTLEQDVFYESEAKLPGRRSKKTSEKNADQGPRPPTTHQTNTPPTAGNGK